MAPDKGELAELICIVAWDCKQWFGSNIFFTVYAIHHGNVKIFQEDFRVYIMKFMCHIHLNLDVSYKDF